jgi:bacillithiol biosynthesis cysteine-adding enzyme BshC
MSISERIFSEKIDHIIQHISSLLPNTEYGQSIVQELQEIYQPGISWSTAFLAIMQKRCSEFGLLFFSASKARILGLFSEMINDELANPGKLKSCIDLANDELANKNLPIQSEAGMINAFYHDDTGIRLKVEYIDEKTRKIGNQEYSITEMEHFFKEHKNQFSPNVLLRPLIQDSILPTIAMIVGPGEAKYMAQLPHAYASYAIPMPNIISRHSGTVIPPSIEKYLTKHDLNVQSFFKTINEIEKELSVRFAHDEAIDASFNGLRSAIATAMGNIQQYANSIDPSLQGTVSATEHGIEKQLENLQKKMTSGLKKKHDQLFLKAHEAHNWLFPNNHLQERVLSSLAIESKIGIHVLRGILSEIKQAERGEHLILIS